MYICKQAESFLSKQMLKFDVTRLAWRGRHFAAFRRCARQLLSFFLLLAARASCQALTGRVIRAGGELIAELLCFSPLSYCGRFTRAPTRTTLNAL